MHTRTTQLKLLSIFKIAVSGKGGKMAVLADFEDSQGATSAVPCRTFPLSLLLDEEDMDIGVLTINTIDPEL